MTTAFKPIKAKAYLFTVGLVDSATTTKLKAAPTISAGNFQVSIDGGAFANLATLPTVTPTGGVAVKIALSAAEMTGDSIVINCTGTGWCDMLIELQTKDPSFANFEFEMRDLGSGLKAGLGSAITATRSIDGGAFAAGTLGAVSEVGYGTYKLAIPIADATYAENLVLYFTANTAGIAQPTKITMTSAF